MKYYIFLSVLFLALSCQKDNNSNNNSDNSQTSAESHSCGATKVHNPSKTYGTVKDIDGNTYKTIQIGSQTWMAENLKTTKYRNGVNIPQINDDAQWRNNTSGAYCNYDKNNSNDCPYGKLYNWYAVGNSNGICPTGYHVPTDTEWTILTQFLGGESKAGSQMKSVGTQYWAGTNDDATNNSGFSGLPAGTRANTGGFFAIKGTGRWWSSTADNDPDFIWYRDVYYEYGYLTRDVMQKSDGTSVRCIKD